MSLKEDQYVFLTSNVSTEIGMQHENKIGNFHTHLPEKLEFDENWEVAMSDVTYTKSWFNFEKEELIRLRFIGNASSSDPNRGFLFGQQTLQPGHYDNIDVLLTDINKLIEEFLNIQQIVSLDFVPQLFVAKTHTNKVISSLGSTKPTSSVNDPDNSRIYIMPVFSKYLSDTLGFMSQGGISMTYSNWGGFVTNDKIHLMALTPQTGFQHKVCLLAKYQHQLNPIRTLYVYTDIIQPRIVGNSKAPLLRLVEIPSKYRYGDDIYIKYKSRFYHPLNHHEIDKISIVFKDDTGKDIRFNFGRTTLTLHFRKKDRPQLD